MTHTKGPWTIGGREMNDVKDSDGFMIACAFHIRHPKPERSVREATANARLIAAAPELLEACQALIAYCDKNPPMGDSLWSVQQIRAAIAKATGGQA